MHLLGYYALIYSRREFIRMVEGLRSEHPAFIGEALSMARIFSRVLPEKDPERTLCARILEAEVKF
ncbi:hypothetical protein DRO55_04285 [Candidatus Bathyarchaeota archaeon]|nr:MAG: hypothetical protein DRO55_04285 [Candidatus Bathyarchaeota archaeon]